MKKNLIFSVLIVFIISACTGLNNNITYDDHSDESEKQVTYKKPKAAIVKKDKIQEQAQSQAQTEPFKKKILVNNWPLDRNMIKAELIQMLEDWGEPAFTVDEELVTHVSYFYKYYSIKDYKRTNRAIERSKKYLSFVIEVFEKYRLPEEIAFALPFVESSFNSNARSGVGAAGMFQFMKGTARNYGLKVTRKLDERLNVYKAAPACARYLRNNRNVFASTVLSLGSYHHGTGKVSIVLLTAANADERNFGAIFKNKRLGKYSKEYIPQCLSAAVIYRFMKERNMSSLPEMNFHSKTIAGSISAKALKQKSSDLYEMNPDLTDNIETYKYASTNGYVLLSNIKIGKISIASSGVFQIKRKPQNKIIAQKQSKSSSKWHKKPDVRPEGNIKVDGRSKYIRYVVQEGNTLNEIASIFGTSYNKLISSRENSYLKRRKPRPGDVIRIDGLAPTTQKMGGGGYVCGKRMDLITHKNDTLTRLCSKVKHTIKKSCKNKKWQLGENITPALIYFWNKDVLEDVGPDDKLKSGIDLVVYTDYLWHKSPSSNKKRDTHVISKANTTDLNESYRRKGKKFVTYIIQDQNIIDGDLLKNISNIFKVNISDLIKWNPWLNTFNKNPRSFIGKHSKIKIKNCPQSTQKFGNPGVVCNKRNDTRMLITKGETIADIANKAKQQIHSCGGKGLGINPENILFWNADILKSTGITNLDDTADKNAKLTIYSDFF